MCGSFFFTVLCTLFALYFVLNLVVSLVLWFHRGLLVNNPVGPATPVDGVTTMTADDTVNEVSITVIVVIMLVQAVLSFIMFCWLAFRKCLSVRAAYKQPVGERSPLVATPAK